MKASPIKELFALPLQSAVHAQVLALQETMAALESWGVEGGQVKVLRLRTERTVEERTVNATTGNAETKLRVEPFEVSIPLLALLPVSAIQLQEMTVDFGVEVVDVKSDTIKSSMVPADLQGSSLAKSPSVFTAVGQSNPTTMKVHMRITKDTPEGIARMNDLLTDLLSGQSERSKKVEDIPGITPKAVKTLKERGVITAGGFLRATASSEAMAETVKALGVTEADVGKWRQEAERLTRIEGPA